MNDPARVAVGSIALQSRVVSPLTQTALDFVRRHGDSKLVEVGAGDGRWLRGLRDIGLTVRGFDLHPSGEGVELGDHLGAAASGGDSLLAIWPPDGAIIQSWIAAAKWRVVVLGCQLPRIVLGDALQDYELAETKLEDGGRKGPYTLYAWRRIAE